MNAMIIIIISLAEKPDVWLLLLSVVPEVELESLVLVLSLLLDAAGLLFLGSIALLLLVDAYCDELDA